MTAGIATGKHEVLIRAEAHRLGFDAVGITKPESIAGAGPRFLAFLELSRHGEMAWLAAKAARRQHPNALWPEAKSIVMLGQNYGPASDPMTALNEKDRGAISIYAKGRDYHHVVKRRLKLLGSWMHRTFKAEVKVFVDTAPVMEKPLAAAAGLGWQGKHTNLVSREFGSWLFLGAIFTPLDLMADRPEADHCGACRACLDICPTNAFPAPYQLDARRCLSYLTIEYPGPIPRAFRAAIGNRVYGCDDCLAICPWNKYARRARDMELWPRAALDLPRLVELAALDDSGFRRLFAGTAIKRIGRDRFVRNVAIALGNSGAGAAVPALRRLLDDAAPLVRGMAVWGLRQILDRAAFTTLKAAREHDDGDPMVAAEWAD